MICQAAKSSVSTLLNAYIRCEGKLSTCIYRYWNTCWTYGPWM